ncbi:translation initiation factor IF-2 N-terminal domain-containing protein [Aliikangiella maris]|uniref:Translation initiation factor IF-2 N-terminal domain-containing protein n=2 Tax=Aliikangiella maris TaxID=3162458 RepID=A0ABV3MLE9_9GAMM
MKNPTYKDYIEAAKNIELLLKNELGATGDSIISQAISVQNSLTEPQLKKLKALGAARNKLVHEENFSEEDMPENFFSLYDSVVSELQPVYLNPHSKKLKLKRKPKTTVKTLAKEMGVVPSYLLKQLNEAGLNIKDEFSQVSEADKETLLVYLKNKPVDDFSDTSIKTDNTPISNPSKDENNKTSSAHSIKAILQWMVDTLD